MGKLNLDSSITSETHRIVAVSELPTGKSGRVRMLRGGDEFCRRMVNLGFTPGIEITVIQNFRHGPILVDVRGTRVALGRGEAVKLLVELV